MNRYYKKGDRIKFKTGYTPYFTKSRYNNNVKEGSKGMILEINHDTFKILLESGKTIGISQEKVDNYITSDDMTGPLNLILIRLFVTNNKNIYLYLDNRSNNEKYTNEGRYW